MKSYTFISVILLLVSWSASGQKIGVSVSNNYTFYSMNPDEKKPSAVPALGVGITYRKVMGEKSALLSGLEYHTFHYQVGRTEINSTSVENSFTSRVINGTFHIPVIYEYRFNSKKINPFIRMGLLLNSSKTTGTTTRVRSRTVENQSVSINGTGTPSSGSTRVYTIKNDNRNVGLSPILELGTFGKFLGGHNWDTTLGVYPLFSVPEYAIPYSFDGVLRNIESPATAIISTLKFRYYFK